MRSHPYICLKPMEHFIVSARKHRPTQFDEVVGQRTITATLENAIANDHLAQALLFTGPRGVGKTTCARILAKKINETSSDQTDEDFAFNIFELDAASNNSVDDIRELIDQVRVPPQVGNYKVYIIDEVHMLSTAAFNAFLKTLEEPPKHAIFILATTEKHKIIPTILSRCQIFDFKRISVLDIKNHLQSIAVKEGITADDDALHIIAQKADGALRDALSAFDRVVGFSGNHLTREAVAENLNVLDYTYYFEITHLLLLNDIPNAFLAYNTILNKGYDGHQFIRGLASHFRDLLVAQHATTINLLEVGDNVKEMYLKQSKMASLAFLKQAIAIANACDLSYKNSQNQRLLVELSLLELASITANEEKKTPIERVTLSPESVARSSETPVFPEVNQQENKVEDLNVTKEETQSYKESKSESSSKKIISSTSEIAKPIELESKALNNSIEEIVTNTETIDSQAAVRSEEATPTTSNDQIITPDSPVTIEPEEISPTASNDKNETPNTEVTTEPKVNEDSPAEVVRKEPEKPKRRKVSALSLSSVEKKQELQREADAKQPVYKEMPKEPFTQEDFEKAWKEYGEIVSKKRQHNLFSHLNMTMPTVSGSIAHVEYPNNTIKIEVERDGGNFLKFIREKLQNYDFNLEITVNDVVTKKYAYTEKEIYDKMAEINPKLNTFRQTLDLDF